MDSTKRKAKPSSLPDILQAWLEGYGAPVELVASNKAFRRAIKKKDGTAAYKALRDTEEPKLEDLRAAINKTGPRFELHGLVTDNLGLTSWARRYFSKRTKS